MTLSKMLFSHPQMHIFSCMSGAFSFQSFGKVVGDGCCWVGRAQLRVCWLPEKKSTLRVAGFSFGERYGQLLAGLGKGGKMKCFTKPEERRL